MISTCRHPELFINLPSDVALNNHSPVSVYASTAQDEIIVRTPDSLMNGLAMEQMIQNCCPEFQYKTLLACDITTILGSIRIANGENTLDVYIECPHCKNSDSYEIPLRQMLVNINAKDWYTDIELPNGLKVSVRPPTYSRYSLFAMEEYKLRKSVMQISALENREDYSDIVLDLDKKHQNLVLDFQTGCIYKIEIDRAEILNQEHIKQWFSNSDLQLQKLITDHISKAEKSCQLETVTINCTDCKKSILFPLDLDFCNLFRAKLVSSDEQQIVTYLEKLNKDIKKLETELLKIVWYMRGGVSLNEAYQLTTYQRKEIAKIVEDNIELTKKTGLPIL